MSGAKTIWKFPLTLTDEAQEVALPGPGKPLLFAEQDGHLFVWWEVLPGQPEEIRRVQVVGTGHQIPGHWGEQWAHVGSLQQGAYVWHLYAA